MAKMFYTVAEAAERLGVSEGELQGMVDSGQLTEFRDRDQLMFKVEQVDLLATGQSDDTVAESGSISLAEDDDPIPLASDDSGPDLGIEEPKEQSGISIFEADELEDADPSAQTQITSGGLAGELSAASVGSGSGLLDLAREADDTSLGADVFEDMYGAEDGGDDAGGDGGLFEETAAPSDLTAPAASAAPAMVAAEPYDGLWSGLGGGLAFGALLVLAFGIAITIMAMMGLTSNPLIDQVRSSYMMWVGILAGVVFLPGIIGMFLGKRG